ncbi:MAG: hypothetical protein E2590_12880 [Chryseobacterium sp.]|nr:hypothetical protein [Chryseobacterium sp.]
MKYLNYDQDGGFRLSTNILSAAQAAYSLFNALGWIAGDKTIITGCTVTGSSVSDGVVFINGEIYEFKGGNIGTNVIIRENITSYAFQNGTNKPVIYDRYVSFGTSTPENTYLWADFKRIFATKDIQAFKDNFESRITALENKPSEWPIGAIIRYDQPLIVLPPAGWEDWNPIDEQGRAWVARSVSDGDFGLGATGGAKTHTLSISEIPSHNHDSIIDASGDDVDSNGGGSAINTSFREITPNRTNVVRVQNKGGGLAHNNLQPYVAVRYIKRIS